MTKTNIFLKEYDGESLYDVGRDVGEAFDSDYNPVMALIPIDELGFLEGTFVVSIVWQLND